MALTTKEIIQLLPFSEEIKKDLLERFDTMDPDQKFNVVELIWDTYNALYDLKLEENMQLALQKAVDKQETLDKDFYKRVKAKTDQDIQRSSTAVETSTDLAEARNALAKILKDTN